MNFWRMVFTRYAWCLIGSIPLLAMRVMADATVTAKGQAYCYDGTTQSYYPMEGVRVELMDSDCDGSEICDDVMGTSKVQADGSFAVTGRGGDPGWIGTDPDVYVRFVYNDDDGVRLTNELNSSRSWNTPEHDHDNTGDGTTIDFGAWSTGNGVNAGDGTQCGVWRQGHIAYQAYKSEFGTPPPAGHLDIEYWSAIYAGTPWTNTDTIHWPIHFGSWALRHEFGHSVRHALDGDGNHFNYDVARFQYARNHGECAADGNRNPSESDTSLRGFAFNEGWAEYWNGDFSGCPSPSRDIEGNIAEILRILQTQNKLARTDMAAVLAANPAAVHSLDEFIGALQRSRPGVITSGLTVSGAGHAAANFVPFTEAQRTHLIATQINQLTKQITDLRKLALIYNAPPQSSTERPCKNCEVLFQRAVAPALIQGEMRVREIQIAALKTAATSKWAQHARAELNAGRYDAFVQEYRSSLREQIRAALLASLKLAETNIRAIQNQLTPAALDSSMSLLAKARARLEPKETTSSADGDRLGWLPQMALIEDRASVASPGGRPNSRPAPKNPAEVSARRLSQNKMGEYWS